MAEAEIPNYESIGDWFLKSREQGYTVPVQAPHLLTLLSKKYNINCADAYQKAITERSLLLVGKTYLVNLARIHNLQHPPELHAEEESEIVLIPTIKPKQP